MYRTTRRVLLFTGRSRQMSDRYRLEYGENPRSQEGWGREPVKVSDAQREHLYEEIRHELELAGYNQVEATKIGELVLRALGRA